MNFNDIELRSNLPYPELENVVQDKNTVQILKTLASGRESELTASLQYIYQSVISDGVMPEIAEILEEIGIVEMNHLEMLMNAIVEFGGNPKYEDGIGNFFSTSNVYYSKKLKEFLDVNIEEEYRAIGAYKRAINAVENVSLKELFKRIIIDEELHIKAFKQIRSSVEFLSLN